jgi:hypothetical protein
MIYEILHEKNVILDKFLKIWCMLKNFKYGNSCIGPILLDCRTGLRWYEHKSNGWNQYSNDAWTQQKKKDEKRTQNKKDMIT